MAVNLEVAKTIPNKTQTRRVIEDIICIRNNPNSFTTTYKDKKLKCGIGDREFSTLKEIEYFLINRFSKWKVGDILWVREPASVNGYNFAYIDGAQMRCNYGSDGKTVNVKIPDRFKSKISDFGYAKWIEKCQGIPNGCLKETARTFFRVTNMRVEQLQDISDEDVIAEGINTKANAAWIRRDYFKILWNKTAPKSYKWEDNPYVFVYEFEKVEVLG